MSDFRDSIIAYLRKNGLIIMSIGLMIAFACLFIVHTKKEMKKDGFDLTCPRDVASVVARGGFFIPAAYMVYAGNYMLLAEYGTAAMAMSVIVEGLKLVVLEERPDGSDNHSFPSGHGSLVTLIVYFVFKRINKKYGALLVIPAFFVFWTRWFYSKHFTHDIVAGIVISLIIVEVFSRIFRPIVNYLKISDR